MKTTLLCLLILVAFNTQAQCEKELREAKENNITTLIITFDGLATAEMKMRLLQRTFVKAAKEACGSDRIIGADFYYSKSGAKEAFACAQSFKKEFGSKANINVVGHSFGAGKGVFNFLEHTVKASLRVDNAVTFDPRGYSYRYKNPGPSVVNQFINIYQKVPLAGMLVSGADKEFNVTGKASHIRLPRKFSKLALKNTLGSLNCL